MGKLQWKTDKEIDLKELSEAITSKKLELSFDCQEDIERGFTFEKDGIEYFVSYDQEAQNNIQDVLRLYDNNMIENYKMTVKLGEDYARIDLNKQEFYELHKESVKHRERNISKLRDILCPAVDKLETLEEVENFSWDSIMEPKPLEPVIRDPKGLQDQIEGINQTFEELLPEDEEGDES